MRPLMLDLCSGLGGASDAFLDAGWDVVRVDNDPALTARRKPGALVWASPVCSEFSRESMPWCRTGQPPSMVLTEACVRVIRECDPEWWVVENVRGAIRYFEPLLGRPRMSVGPFFLWGRFPLFDASVGAFRKEALSSTAKAERAKVPASVSLGLLDAIEQASRQIALPVVPA